MGWFQKPKKIEKTRKIIETEKQTKIVSFQAKISDTPFDQKFFLTSGSGCFAMAHTYGPTHIRTLRIVDSIGLGADSVQKHYISLYQKYLTAVMFHLLFPKAKGRVRGYMPKK